MEKFRSAKINVTLSNAYDEITVISCDVLYVSEVTVDVMKQYAVDYALRNCKSLEPNTGVYVKSFQILVACK